jgi:hypothetical protein
MNPQLQPSLVKLIDLFLWPLSFSNENHLLLLNGQRNQSKRMIISCSTVIIWNRILVLYFANSFPMDVRPRLPKKDEIKEESINESPVEARTSPFHPFNSLDPNLVFLIYLERLKGQFKKYPSEQILKEILRNTKKNRRSIVPNKIRGRGFRNLPFLYPILILVLSVIFIQAQIIHHPSFYRSSASSEPIEVIAKSANSNSDATSIVPQPNKIKLYSIGHFEEDSVNFQQDEINLESVRQPPKKENENSLSIQERAKIKDEARRIHKKNQVQTLPKLLEKVKKQQKKELEEAYQEVVSINQKLFKAYQKVKRDRDEVLKDYKKLLDYKDKELTKKELKNRIKKVERQTESNFEITLKDFEDDK